MAGTTLAVGMAGCGGMLGGGKSELDRQLDSVRSATEQYADPKAALEAGFKLLGPYIPGMGWHFLHPDRTKAAAENGFTLEEPQLLTYLETDGGLTLGAAEYGAPVEAVPENPDLFADEGQDATETWHTHTAATHVIATGDGEAQAPDAIPFEQWVTNDNWAEFRPPDPDLQAGDTIALNWGTAHGNEGEATERVVDLASSHPDLRTLHVWVHMENPGGVFKPMNEDFGGGGHGHERIARR